MSIQPNIATLLQNALLGNTAATNTTTTQPQSTVTGTSATEIAKIRREARQAAFTAADKDQTGVLGLTEFKNYFVAQNPDSAKRSDADFAKLYGQFDENKDNLLQPKEVVDHKPSKPGTAGGGIQGIILKILMMLLGLGNTSGSAQNTNPLASLLGGSGGNSII